MPWPRYFFKKTPLSSTSQHAQAQRRVQFEALEPRLLLSADLAVLDDGGLNDYFDKIQQQLNDEIFSAPIPLIGTQLAERQVGQIAERISGRLDSFTVVPTSPFGADAEDVKEGLLTALGDLIVGGTITDSTNADNTQYWFSQTLGGFESASVTLDLALGQDAVINPQLGIDDEVTVSFDWSLDLVFGVYEDVNAESVFFVDTGFTNELKLENLTAVLDGGDDGKLEAKGTAGIFGALIQLDAGRPGQAETVFDAAVAPVAARSSQFLGEISIDIAGAGPDSRMTTAELGNLTVDGVVSGAADINLDIDAAMIPDFADVAASDRTFNLAVEGDVNITQDFVSVNTQADTFGDDIVLRYEDVRLDLGTFFSETVDPFVKGLQLGLSPIKPVVDFLNFPIPVLSDIGEEIGLGEVTPIGLGILSTPFRTDLTKKEKDQLLSDLTKTKAVIEMLDIIFSLGPIAEGLPDTPSMLGFDIQIGANGKRDSTAKLDDDGKPLEDKRPVEVIGTDPNKTLSEEVKSKSTKTSQFFGETGGALAFPFLNDPSLVQGMLLGDTSAVIASVGLDFEFGYFYEVSIPIIAPFLTADFRFDIGAQFDFDAGFDLFGANALTQSLDFSSEALLQQSVDDNIHRLADGFFMDDHIGDDAPADLQDGVYDPTEADRGDAPEITVSAKLSAGASVGPDLLIAEF